MNNWSVKKEVSHLFADLEGTWMLDGEIINENWMSRLVRFASDGDHYYIKKYAARGRGARRYLGRSRARAEWENLAKFRELEIPTADLVAFGESTDPIYQGVIVTREVRGTTDLAALVSDGTKIFQDSDWKRRVIDRLSAAVRRLHLDGFVHNDLKWRNILVDPSGGEPLVYLIDCPMGRRLWGPLLSRGRIKDLACLDKVGKVSLSRTDRLRFYLAYRKMRRLDPRGKKEIFRILEFFKGRE